MTLRRFYDAWLDEMRPAHSGYIHHRWNKGVTWRVQRAVRARPIMFAAIGQERYK